MSDRPLEHGRMRLYDTKVRYPLGHFMTADSQVIWAHNVEEVGLILRADVAQRRRLLKGGAEFVLGADVPGTEQRLRTEVVTNHENPSATHAWYLDNLTGRSDGGVWEPQPVVHRFTPEEVEAAVDDFIAGGLLPDLEATAGCVSSEIVNLMRGYRAAGQLALQSQGLELVAV